MRLGRRYTMKEFTYVIEDPNGLHARPAGKLATFAKQFASEILVKCGEKQADGKRLLSLMTLGATSGSTLCFSVSGEDEESAYAALEAFCKSNLNGGN